MRTRMVAQLSDHWCVQTDGVQWMLSNRYKGKTGKYGDWHPVSFVASTKDVLLRCIREQGAVVDVAGEVALANMPHSPRGFA